MSRNTDPVTAVTQDAVDLRRAAHPPPSRPPGWTACARPSCDGAHRLPRPPARRPDRHGPGARRRSSTRSGPWPPAASGCGRRSPTGAGAARGRRAAGRGRRRGAPRRRRAGVRARQRAGPRRRHGRRAHPPRPPGHPRRLRRPARRATALAGDGDGVRHRRRDPARRPRAGLVRRAAAAARASRAAALARARAVWDTMRTEVTAGQYLDLLRAAGGLPGAARRADRGPLQERRLHRAAAAAAGRRASPAPAPRCWRPTPRSGCRWARRSSCATTSWACSATPRSPASPPTTTCARASGPCWSRSPRSAPTEAGRAAAARRRWATPPPGPRSSTRCAGCSRRTGARARVEQRIAERHRARPAPPSPPPRIADDARAALDALAVAATARTA